MKKRIGISATGIPWYRRDEYDRIRALMDDGARLPATFEDWEGKARHLLEKLQREGHIAVQVDLGAEEFARWCRDRGCRLDADARMQFAAEVAAHQQKRT